MALPSFTSSGLLPPYTGDQIDQAKRSPYAATIVELVTAFGASPSRQAILNGLLDYRKTFHGLGFTDGFQWINGSFCSDIEMIESRPPGDVDIVTFLRAPPGTDKQAIAAAYPELFDSDEAKDTFCCDAYVVDLDIPAEILVLTTTYWSNVWGHNRSNVWKGFLQVDLHPGLDADARAILLGAGVAP